MKVAAHAGAAIASVARATYITLIASLCVVAYTFGALRRLAIRDRGARDEHRARQRGRLLRWSFERLGAIFVKIGQVASSRPDLFSPRVIEQLRTLQDHVPPFAYKHVRAILARELGAPIEWRFRTFDPVPVAAGGIAQVHHAVLLDGTEVAVKVLRPGVRARVHRDGRLLFWLAHVAHALSARARAADVIGHVRSLIAGIIAQVELRTEARSYVRFRRAFAGSQAIAFPRVFAGLSTSDVLVMEFVHGATLDNLRPDQVPVVTRALREAFFAMCFEHGVVHADLHPGNVLVRDDNVVVLLDLGLVKYLSRDVIDKIVDFARCMVIGNGCDLVGHLQRYHHCPPSIDWDAVGSDAAAFIARLRARSIAELEVSAVVGELFALARKHRIRPMAEISLVLLAMVTIEGIAKRLDPSANTMVELTRYLVPRIGPERRIARGTGDWRPSAEKAVSAAGDRQTPAGPRRPRARVYRSPRS